MEIERHTQTLQSRNDPVYYSPAQSETMKIQHVKKICLHQGGKSQHGICNVTLHYFKLESKLALCSKSICVLCSKDLETTTFGTTTSGKSH